ncbi:MAG: M24 family metallopeptidase [Candidatus Omnitrophota bacterium]|nr:MAG: M24 family metallopeptidase [Candidatus Omnitrophota bacterium]
MGRDSAKIKNLTKAARITKNIFNAVSKKVKPGVRESEITREIDNIIKKKGLKPSFRTIVASGPNAAKPHAKVTERIIKHNDMVVIDFGVIYKSCHSDMTRTVIIGKIDAKMKKLYKIVETAQRMAIKKIRPGLKISDFVSDIYGYIRKAGMGKYILHGLGHGIRKKVHEAPRLTEKNRRRLRKGMVITIEPGLYIKQKGGVRIEDMVLVTEKGPKVLTR